MTDYKKIKLKPKKEASLKRFHPWVFSGAIASIDQGVDEGDIVEIYANDDSFLGVGHYQIGSIAVRIVSFQKREIDTSFFIERLTQAYQLRNALGLIRNDNNTYRLVHGEGDMLSGLIVDIYGSMAVVQAHSVGMHMSRKMITTGLENVLNKSLSHVYYKSETTLPFKAPINPEDDFLMGGADIDKIALENNLKFQIDWEKGQKTGFFIDQRENRSLLEKYSYNRSVLNMFCYTGGFSVYAMRGGARSVTDVDSSGKAVMLANENIKRNFGDDDRYKSSSDDAFKFLKEIPNDAYDLIVLDPPAFAKHRGAVRNALQGYKKLNFAAFEKIKTGGIVFTFSCSQVISREQFRLAVFSAAAISGRKVQILHQLSQPADHPVNIYHPEGEYLKGLVLHVY
ncbi:MAG: class I SAM-dependent rRNA methyltransferase [Dysgonamonadaceae bacterium]|nr:class I SAM-dependent rRNA methyltransferase [Dysgonamonadaceae bacterium]